MSPKPDLVTPGTRAWTIEVAAQSELHAQLLAGRNRTVKKLSWFHMKATEIEPGRWSVKVAYIVESPR